MKDVLALRDPLQVLQGVVVSIPVLMVDHKALVNAEKRLSDKPVDVSHDPLSAVMGGKSDPQVTVFGGLQQPRATNTKQPFNLALRRNKVSVLETNNR
jgi:hypothetical protein